jgi:uncharacterized protein
LPLSAGSDERTFKTYFLDIGLISCRSELDLKRSQDPDFLNKGQIAEQFICQQLQHVFSIENKQDIYYWLNDKKIGKSEIDFIVQMQNQIIPIEVKAGASKSLKSMWYFLNIKKMKQAIHFSTHLFNFEKMSHLSFSGDSKNLIQAKIFQLPLYQVENLKYILQNY